MIPLLYKHSTPIKLRFSDMDSFGHINNANYLTYFEEARVSYVNDVLDTTYDWSKKGIILAHAAIDFKIPGNFRDKVEIYTRCIKIGTKSFTLEQSMIETGSDPEKVFAIAKTVVVMFDYERNVSIPVLDAWKDALIKYEGKQG